VLVTIAQELGLQTTSSDLLAEIAEYLRPRATFALRLIQEKSYTVMGIGQRGDENKPFFEALESL
jgi:hypothetical protein